MKLTKQNCISAAGLVILFLIGWYGTELMWPKKPTTAHSLAALTDSYRKEENGCTTQMYKIDGKWWGYTVCDNGYSRLYSN